MDRWLAPLRNRKTAFPIVCGIGSVALLAGLMYGGVIDPSHTALIILAVYIGSKIFMGAALVWVVFRHSSLLKRVFARINRR